MKQTTYQQDVLGVTGERLGVHSETVRQARQFADPESGYTQAEVEELCRAIRDIQSESEAGGVFSKTHVVRILTIPKATRAKFQMEAIRGGWSTNRLESEISSRFGSRRQGGRKREIPREAAGLLA